VSRPMIDVCVCVCVCVEGSLCSHFNLWTRTHVIVCEEKQCICESMCWGDARRSHLMFYLAAVPSWGVRTPPHTHTHTHKSHDMINQRREQTQHPYWLRGGGEAQRGFETSARFTRKDVLRVPLLTSVRK